MRCKFGVLMIVALMIVVGMFSGVNAGVINFVSLSDLNLNENFQVNPVLLKTVITSNGSYDSHVKITNLKDKESNFNISLINLEGLVSIEDTNFVLSGRQEKDVGVIFSNLGGRKEGVYSGGLEISDYKSKMTIPVILEVESEDVLFDSNVDMFSSGSIAPGGKVSAEIKIFDLSRIGTSTIYLNYFIKDFDGKIIKSEREELIISNSVVMTKSFDISEDIPEGDYVFGVVLEYKNSVGTSSAIFQVKKEPKKSFVNSLFDNDMFVFIIIFLVIILILLFFVFYSIYSRDKLLNELKYQYRSEMKKQIDYLSRKEKENERKLKTSKEKRLNRKLFSKVKSARRKMIKGIQKERVKTLKQIKKKKPKTWKSESKKQITKWKKQGYDTSVLEGKIKTPTVNDIKSQIQSWKKKGYDTGVLEK